MLPQKIIEYKIKLIINYIQNLKKMFVVNFRKRNKYNFQN